MVICSICAHSDWCDGGDTCDCRCHEIDPEYYEEYKAIEAFEED
jgi:hypothetical protein